MFIIQFFGGDTPVFQNMTDLRGTLTKELTLIYPLCLNPLLPKAVYRRA